MVLLVRVAAIVGFVIALVVGAIAAVAISIPVGLVVGLLAGVGGGAAVALISSREPEAAILRSAGAVALSDGAEPRFTNAVEGLSVSAGVPKPALHLMNHAGMNVLAVGRDPRHAALAVTQGLLDGLSLIELEAVLARELAQIRSLDTLPGTVAAGLLLGPLAPLARLVGLPSPTRGPVETDLAGVLMTRYPPGLAAALRKVAASPSPPVGPAAVPSLWLAPGDAGGVPADLSLRIATIDEL